MITDDANVKALLKTYYRQKGPENLLYRNSPVLAVIGRERIEGKDYKFSAMYGRGGACAGDCTQATSVASTVSRNTEFTVTPGQLFSVYTMNAKQILAARTQKGAYMTVAGAQFFASLEALRKTIALALYGTGYGEFGAVQAAKTLTVGSNTATMTEDAVLKIDVGSVFRVTDGSLPADTLRTSVNTVTAINGTTVTFTATNADTWAAGDLFELEGSRDASGSPYLPIGLEGWLPTLGARTGSAWATYIATAFFGVVRSVSVEALCGSYVAAATAAGKMADSVMEGIRLARRRGANSDMVVMNDADFLAMMVEIEGKQTFFQKTNGGEKGTQNEVTKGLSAFKFAFSTSWVNNVYEDPYCPLGRFYVLEKDNIAFLTYTNVEKLNDGISGNNPGTQDPMTQNDNGNAEKPNQLLYDDFVTVQSGATTADGPSTTVTCNLFGSFVVYNPAHCAVGNFYEAA
ncbi:MAG TPA: hypothetical protein DCO75_02155 [Fibrobacteres bacterium]|jgi:hypothetical protein|nr:hypothetical protein [Fibrobacterota bacterium]